MTEYVKVIGPMTRLTPFERCACGLAYTSYKVHRETKHHKAALLRWRQEARGE